MVHDRREARLKGNLFIGDRASMSGNNCPVQIAQLNNDLTTSVALLNRSDSILAVLIQDLCRSFKLGDGITFIAGPHVGQNAFVLTAKNDLKGTVMMYNSPQVRNFIWYYSELIPYNLAIQKYSSLGACSA
jgi:hypothetical protein